MLKRILRRVRRELNELTPQHRRWRRELAERDARFDAEHGVNTTPGQPISKLTIDSPNRAHSHGHVGSQPEEFKRAMDALPIAFEQFSFVDLGSGKGRAVLLALGYPFRQHIGVEFARELHDVAEENLRGKPVTLVCGDATAFEFPEGPLVVFLYNPFGAEVMEKVARRLRDHPAALHIVYVNPFHINAWLDQGFEVTGRGSPFAILARTAQPLTAGA